jgi:hypothetical protein
MIEGGWYFHGQETLGLISHGSNDIEFPDAPFLDYQFAGLARDKILQPCRKFILSELQKLIDGKRKEDWLVIFLTTFMLLNTYSLLIKQQIQFAKETKPSV